jgi:hypothetical protein
MRSNVVGGAPSREAFARSRRLQPLAGFAKILHLRFASKILRQLQELQQQVEKSGAFFHNDKKIAVARESCHLQQHISP